MSNKEIKKKANAKTRFIVMLVAGIAAVSYTHLNPGKKEKGVAAAGLLLNVLGLLANWVYFSAWAQYGGAGTREKIVLRACAKQVAMIKYYI